jgi:hypothetical protein
MSDWWSYLSIFDPTDPENFEVGLIILATAWFLLSCVRLHQQRRPNQRSRLMCLTRAPPSLSARRWPIQGGPCSSPPSHLAVRRCLLEFLAYMFDPDYEDQPLVGEEGGNPYEDKKAAAAAGAAGTASENKKDK